jgi:hypothetical protein
LGENHDIMPWNGKILLFSFSGVGSLYRGLDTFILAVHSLPFSFGGILTIYSVVLYKIPMSIEGQFRFI